MLFRSYGYLHMDFGRPTILVIPVDGKTVLITPTMEEDLAGALAQVERVDLWNDGLGNEWRETLPAVLGENATIGIEPELIPPVVKRYLDSLVPSERLADVTPVISAMRMIKSEEELKIARHAGEVGMAMMTAARETIGEGVAEFEIALAATTAGTQIGRAHV